MGAQVFIDECHATGFLGANGRGTPELLGVEGRIDIINSTLGKALGGATGGYTSGKKQVVDILRQRSRPYLFSNTLAPAVVGASLEGFNLSGAQECPIVPVMLGDARLASEMSDELLKKGIYVIGFSYPVVPKGKARIRVQLSASHS